MGPELTTAVDTALEIKVIQRCIVPQKRERYAGFVRTTLTRGKFLRELAHLTDQLEGFERVVGIESDVVLAKAHLIGRSALCYVISENSRWDGRIWPAEIALTEIIGYDMGSLLVFGDAELVFYEGEGLKNRWISRIFR